jgi:riboflavin synthase
MFTGLVEATGTVAAVDDLGDGARVSVSTPLAAELADGDSIAVNGVCLTARGATERTFSADVMAETLRRSSLGPLATGDRVNLELPVRAGGRLGGHVVQGHVDGVGTVVSIADEGLARVVRVAAGDQLLRYVVEKGSIAIDGVSLTVSAVDDEALEVSLIPETLERTTLGSLTAGSAVNLEVDVLAKYVEKLMNRTVEAP